MAKKKKFPFEKKVIDTILNTIKKHQVYLTQKENLPQLAKLGYMYNTLWYAGRICWGGNGLIQKGGYDCEDNPKYKIEMVEPENEEIEDLVYDAWGMHVMEDNGIPDFETFSKTIREGKVYTEFEKKLRKPNKTIPEWIEVLTDKQYRYSSLYQTKRSVYSHLLCCIGNGYGINKEGFIMQEASGADQDKDLYGEWENSKFSPEIQDVVNEIIAIPELKETLDVAHKYIQKENKKLNSVEEGTEAIKKLMGKFKKTNPKLFKEIFGADGDEEEEIPYRAYYPISTSSIIGQIHHEERDVYVEPSIVAACIEICEDIVTHEKEEIENDKGGNVQFAKEFLAKHGRDEFKSFIPVTIDKYALLQKINNLFQPVTNYFKLVDNKNTPAVLTEDLSILYLNNTKDSDYADNNYYGSLRFSSTTSDELPKNLSNNLDLFKTHPAYNAFMKFITGVKKLSDVKAIRHYYNNIKQDGQYSYCNIDFEIIVNDKYQYGKDLFESEELFVSQGFNVGKHQMSFEIPEANVGFIFSKPKPLGSTHPYNISGKEYFSQAKSLDMYELSSGEIIGNFFIDERGFNSIRVENKFKKSPEKVKWVLEEHANFKSSDPDFGSGKKEGKRKLYTQDFILWLKKSVENKLLTS